LILKTAMEGQIAHNLKINQNGRWRWQIIKWGYDGAA